MSSRSITAETEAEDDPSGRASRLVATLAPPPMAYVSTRRVKNGDARNGDANRLYRQDRAIHEWYRFVLSFLPHLVREYIGRFDLGPGRCVLDPFCGTGMTLVEAKKLGVAGVGFEVNPLAEFASRTQVDWTPDSRRRRGARRAGADGDQ
jgi:SAM-dependent methyltransferase